MEVLIREDEYDGPTRKNERCTAQFLNGIAKKDTSRTQLHLYFFIMPQKTNVYMVNFKVASNLNKNINQSNFNNATVSLKSE